jgi:hypothetical protein
MKFSEVVNSIGTFVELKRIAKAYVIDYRNLTQDELKQALIKTAPQYYHKENLESTIQMLLLHPNRKIRVLYPLFIKDILLNKDDFMCEQRLTESEIIDIEQATVNESNEITLAQSNEKSARLDLLRFVLECAWENNHDISPDEKNLIEKIRKRINISDYEYRIIEARIGKFPTDSNKLHTKDEIEDVRRYLQEAGLLFTIRDADKENYDIIPEEIVKVLREILGIELKKHGYKDLIQHKIIRSKKYYQDILTKADVEFSNSMKTNQLQELCINRIRPSLLLGGFSPRDGLNTEQLINWCHEINIPCTGTKSELIRRIIQYYDNIKEKKTVEELEDERKLWFEYFEELASRNLNSLRQQGLISKDIECERKFEAATNYLFERYLGHTPLMLKGTEHPDGILSFNNKLVFWDNKSKESPVHLADHIKQFDRYIRNAEKPIACFIVIGPDFTPESQKECLKYSLTNDTIITLVKAKDLKDIAKSWNIDSSFPLGYFRQVGLFDKSLIS